MNPDDAIELPKADVASDVALELAEALKRFEKTVVEDCANTCDERVMGHCTAEDQLAGRCVGALRAEADNGQSGKL
jgi:hypothetical protein